MDTKTPENSAQTPTLVITEIAKKPRKKRESKKPKPPTFTISYEPVVVSFK
jgi:hypothetical protein